MNIFDDFLNLLLPSQCVICEKSGSPICATCSDKYLTGTRVVFRSDLNGLAICEYQGKIQNLIHEFKETAQTFLAREIAKSMVQIVPKSCQVLVPMPSKQTSFAKRGFVPAQVLAHHLAVQIAKKQHRLIQVCDSLSYARVVQDQASLSGHDRRTNLTGAMKIIKPIRHGEVWLLDDIVTTGATLLEARRCLGEQGVRVAGFVAFAETLPKNKQKSREKVI